MKVKVNNNVVTVVTDIPVSVAKKGLVEPVAYDSNNNPVYKVRVDLDGNGSLSQFGMVANTVIDDKLAVVLVAPLGMSREEIKLKYGKAVVAAGKYCPVIAEAAAAEEAIIDAAFGDASVDCDEPTPVCLEDAAN